MSTTHPAVALLLQAASGQEIRRTLPSNGQLIPSGSALVSSVVSRVVT